jgi:endonuclease/exonuclease/phosphatase family metal-dependent hydrolase
MYTLLTYSTLRKGLAVVLLAVFGLLQCASEKRAVDVMYDTFTRDQLKAATFNIRLDYAGDGANNWHKRKEAVVSFLKSEALHIVGMQEVLDNQFQFLKDNLPGYQAIGVGREDGATKGEYSPIFFREDVFAVVDSGTFWLSTTPEEPSVGWDAALERICTYAVLRDERNGREVHFYNTHFDHVGEDARVNSAALIMDSIAAKSVGHWVILSGDFNVEPSTVAYKTIVQTDLQDSYEQATVRLGPVGTFNGFNPDGNYSRRIDYVFSRGFSVELYEANNLSYNDNFLSDHFPVITLLEYMPI